MREGGPARSREQARRVVVVLLFVFYGLLLAEGPLRKWIMPGASNALVFVRDPVMILLLLAYARLGLSPPTRRLLGVLCGVCGGLMLCMAGQLATSGVPALALLAGLRNYVLFVPLCCAVADAFEAQDYARWVKLNLILAPPIAVLVVAQYRAGPSAWINAVPGGGDEGVFLLVEDVVRPYGLFSFTLGHSAYAAWMIGTVLAAAIARRRLQVGRTLLGSGAVGVMAMGLFSGSRTYLLLGVCVLGAFLAGSAVFGRPVHRRLAAAIVASLVLATSALVAVEPSIAADLLDRQASATASEGATSDRIGHVVGDFADAVGTVPALGYGLGSGTNIANFLSNGRTDHVLAEYELTRIVQELGPFFGLSVILLRWSLVGWFCALAIRAARQSGNLQPCCYLGFLAPVFVAHDVTLQNSMIGIAWFAAGIFLAVVRLGSPRTATGNATRGGLIREIRRCG